MKISIHYLKFFPILAIIILLIQASLICSCNNSDSQECKGEEQKKEVNSSSGVQKSIQGATNDNENSSLTNRNFTESQEKAVLSGYTFNDIFKFSKQKNIVSFRGNTSEQIFFENKNFFKETIEKFTLEKFKYELDHFKNIQSNSNQNYNSPFIPATFNPNHQDQSFSPFLQIGHSETELESLSKYIPSPLSVIEVGHPGYIEVRFDLKKNETNSLFAEYVMLGQTYLNTFFKVTVLGEITNISSNIFQKDQDVYHIIEITLSEKPLCHSGGAILAVRGYQSLGQVTQDKGSVGKCNGPIEGTHSYRDTTIAEIRNNFFKLFYKDVKVYLPFRIIKDKDNNIRFQTFHPFLNKNDFGRNDNNSDESDYYITPFGTQATNNDDGPQFHEDMRIITTITPLSIDKNVLIRHFKEMKLNPINLGIKN